MFGTVCIVIPAYKPDQKLINLINLINELNNEPNIKFVVINDGSPIEFDYIFNEIKKNSSNVVLNHFSNFGKGRALKTGFYHCLHYEPNAIGIVTADADGQHLLSDIIKVILQLRSTLNNKINFLIVGSRLFNIANPLRSRIGNKLTQVIFKYMIGLNISDTQSGLRAIPKSLLNWSICVPGERYEYETNILLECSLQKIPVIMEPIEAIYLDNNKNSHFNPIKDSMRIYFLIFRFLSSSLSSAILDIILFSLFYKNNYSIIQSTLMARFLSSWLNFYLNRKIVFKNSYKFISSLLKYWLLVLIMGLVSSFILIGMTNFSLNIIFLKFLIESTLFLASFSIQKEFIFNTDESTLKDPL